MILNSRFAFNTSDSPRDVSMQRNGCCNVMSLVFELMSRRWISVVVARIITHHVCIAIAAIFWSY